MLIIRHSYPLVFAITIIPNTVVRWIGFMQENSDDNISRVPQSVSFIARAIFGLSGIANVLLFVVTRPGIPLLGFNDPRDSVHDEKRTSLAFGPLNTDLTHIDVRPDPIASESGETGIIELVNNMGIRLVSGSSTMHCDRSRVNGVGV
jgi:hypothetical protein